MDLGSTYTKIGDYYYPNIALSDTTKYDIGYYGRKHERYLKEHRPSVWARLVLTEELNRHLFEIDTACNEQMEYLSTPILYHTAINTLPFLKIPVNAAAAPIFPWNSFPLAPGSQNIEDSLQHLSGRQAWPALSRCFLVMLVRISLFFRNILFDFFPEFV